MGIWKLSNCTSLDTNWIHIVCVCVIVRFKSIPTEYSGLSDNWIAHPFCEAVIASQPSLLSVDRQKSNNFPLNLPDTIGQRVAHRPVCGPTHSHSLVDSNPGPSVGVYRTRTSIVLHGQWSVTISKVPAIRAAHHTTRFNYLGGPLC